MSAVDVLSVGRISVDLYAREPDVGFEGQQSFHKSVGGSPSNVAVAAARLATASCWPQKLAQTLLVTMCANG